MKSARLAAFELIYGVLQNEAYSNLSLASAAKEVKRGDAAFLSALSHGVLERKLTLDYLIAPYLNSPPKPKVKILLYLGAYQLYFMDKVPASAAINETVELAKQVGCAYYEKLINAVLHKIDKHRVDMDTVEDVSVLYSCPEPLIKMWQKHYGNENTQHILEAMNSPAPVFAVPNPLYVDADELCYELLSEGLECETDGDLVRIRSPFDIRKLRAFKNGLFHIEDKSSYQCAAALDAKAGETVLDVCAAPGGKAFTVCGQMNNEGTLYAYDLHSHRVQLIKDGAERLGLTALHAAVNDATVFNETIPQADRILCDVPCSGFGIIRRKPEIRYKSLDSVKELPALQYTILTTSAQYLKNGGRLVYSTCTLNRKENEKVCERFLAEHGNFRLLEQVTVFPQAEGGDGFYYAVMEKYD